MTLLPAWAIQGGSAAPEVARAMAFAATGGRYAAGVVEWPDLKVTANGTSQIQVAPGVAVIPTRYSSSASQATYVVANDAEMERGLSPTGSGSGQTWYIILRVEDPQYGGAVPSDPATAAYSYISATNILENPFPFVLLARVDMPPSTTNITQGMITDLRNVSQPRTLMETRFVSPIVPVDVIAGNTAKKNLATSSTMYIPPWATRARVFATYSGLQIRDAAWTGVINTRFGGVNLGNVRVDENTPSGGDWSRCTYSTADEVLLTDGQRDKQLSVVFQAQWTHVAGGRMRADIGSSFSAFIHFTEEPA